jgi:hypothetical protein
VSEVGFVRANADVSLGKTAPNGVTIAFSGNDAEVESGQSTFLEDTFRTQDRAEITLRLIYADLVQFKDLLGLPDSALTGDLAAAEPTEEVLSVAAAGALGSREETLYVLSPGPKSTRRYEFARVKARAGLNVEISRDNHIVLEQTFYLLAPAAGTDAITVTDAL